MAYDYLPDDQNKLHLDRQKREGESVDDYLKVRPDLRYDATVGKFHKVKLDDPTTPPPATGKPDYWDSLKNAAKPFNDLEGSAVGRAVNAGLLTQFNNGRPLDPMSAEARDIARERSSVGQPKLSPAQIAASQGDTATNQWMRLTDKDGNVDMKAAAQMRAVAGKRGGISPGTVLDDGTSDPAYRMQNKINNPSASDKAMIESNRAYTLSMYDKAAAANNPKTGKPFGAQAPGYYGDSGKFLGGPTGEVPAGATRLVGSRAPTVDSITGRPVAQAPSSPQNTYLRDLYSREDTDGTVSPPESEGGTLPVTQQADYLEAHPPSKGLPAGLASIYRQLGEPALPNNKTTPTEAVPTAAVPTVSGGNGKPVSSKSNSFEVSESAAKNSIAALLTPNLITNPGLVGQLTNASSDLISANPNTASLAKSLAYLTAGGPNPTVNPPLAAASLRGVSALNDWRKSAVQNPVVKDLVSYLVGDGPWNSKKDEEDAKKKAHPPSGGLPPSLESIYRQLGEPALPNNKTTPTAAEPGPSTPAGKAEIAKGFALKHPLDHLSRRYVDRSDRLNTTAPISLVDLIEPKLKSEGEELRHRIAEIGVVGESNPGGAAALPLLQSNLRDNEEKVLALNWHRDYWNGKLKNPTN